MSRLVDRMIEEWNRLGTPVEARLSEALTLIERMHERRLEADRKIHNQRRALRENWEVVEMRRRWLGSHAVRRAYCALLKRHRALLATDSPPGQEG